FLISTVMAAAGLTAAGGAGGDAVVLGRLPHAATSMVDATAASTVARYRPAKRRACLQPKPCTIYP
ncbi:MAG: hypothetical protein M3325_11465, partial [Actinomycetota bacterium]|nr:hypothetical protein [Actinomycetota bacterium]